MGQWGGTRADGATNARRPRNRRITGKTRKTNQKDELVSSRHQKNKAKQRKKMKTGKNDDASFLGTPYQDPTTFSHLFHPQSVNPPTPGIHQSGRALSPKPHTHTPRPPSIPAMATPATPGRSHFVDDIANLSLAPCTTFGALPRRSLGLSAIDGIVQRLAALSRNASARKPDDHGSNQGSSADAEKKMKTG